MDNIDNERVTYTIQPGARNLVKTLYEGTGAANAGTLTDRLDPAVSGFVYLDEVGNNLGDPVPLANLEDIRVVVINLAVEELAGRVGTLTRNSVGRIMCRNLGL